MSILIKFQPRIPNVSILEPKFDFGQLIAQGIPGSLPLTMVNSSNVAATLILDLRPSEFAPGVECLDIQLLENKLSKQYHAYAGPLRATSPSSR